MCFGLAWLEHDSEAIGSLEDDVSLQLEILLRNGALDMEVSHDRAEKNFELEHGVLATYATSRPGTERNVTVVVTVLSALGKEVVGIELLRVVVDVGSAMDAHGANNHGCASWNDQVLRHQLQVLVDLTSNQRYWRIQAKCLENYSLEIFHLNGVVESHFAV